MFVAAVVTFWPGLSGDFLNWDDRDNVVNNPGVHGLGREQLVWMWTGAVLGHYIPLTWMSFGLNYVVGGLKPWGYHALNMLLHGANAVLFYLIARRLIALARPGGTEAGSWALSRRHLLGPPLRRASAPRRVRGVDHGAQGRPVRILLLGSVLAYLKAVAAPAIDRRWQVVSLVSFGAALLAKAAAVPLPAILVLLDVYPLRRPAERTGWLRVIVEKIPWAILSVAGAAVALNAVYRGTAVTDYARYGAGARLAMTAYTFIFYPARWFWPVELLPLYELPQEIRFGALPLPHPRARLRGGDGRAGRAQTALAGRPRRLDGLHPHAPAHQRGQCIPGTSSPMTATAICPGWASPSSSAAV